MKQAVGKSACDFTFHMSVTNLTTRRKSSARNRQTRHQLVQVYLAYKGAFGVDDTELYRTLKLAKELGSSSTAHCENETPHRRAREGMLAAGKTDSGQHHESRPPQVEAEGVNHLMSFAELTGAATYIVHLSCKEALDAPSPRATRRARERRDIDPISHARQNLREKPKMEGAKYVMSPPLRDKSNQPFCGTACATGWFKPSRPTIAPSISRRRKNGVEMISQKFPTAFVARRPHQRALHLRREDGQD